MTLFSKSSSPTSSLPTEYTACISFTEATKVLDVKGLVDTFNSTYPASLPNEIEFTYPLSLSFIIPPSDAVVMRAVVKLGPNINATCGNIIQVAPARPK